MVGNTPNYSRFDVVRSFLRLDTKMSRQQLAKELELGEGTMRSILDILKERGLIRSHTQGHEFTQKGQSLAETLRNLLHIKYVKLSLYPALKCVAGPIDSREPITYEHRDIAVKSGAQGALIVQVKNKRLIRPDASVEQDFAKLEQEFALDDSKVMIITFSDSFRSSEIAAFSVAVSLSKELEQVIGKSF